MVSINAMSQNDPAAFTLNDVSQFIYFISYTARCPGQTKNSHYFLPTIFRNVEAKKVPLVPVTRSILKSSSLPTLISYMIAFKTILQKNSFAGKWERRHSPKGHMANRTKLQMTCKVEGILECKNLKQSLKRALLAVITRNKSLK